MITPTLSELAERSEADALHLWVSGVPEPEREILGTSATRIGGGVVCSMANDPTGYWSKALGFGFERPVDSDLIGEVVDFYRAAGTAAATLQIAPAKLPDDWDEICQRFGITRENSWVKLSGGVDIAERPLSGLRVGAVPAEEISEWAHVVFRGFGMPEEHLAAMAIASTESPRVHPFAVWDGGRLVAGACLVMRGTSGHLFGAATLADYRNRGAQTALIASRAQAAKAAGATRLFAETWVPAPGQVNASLSNMLRAGLTPLYERANWRWTA